MAIVKPFKGIRPPKELVEKVESRPYDVLDSEEARAEAGDNAQSLYHIIKPEIDFPVGTSEYLVSMRRLQRTSRSSRTMDGWFRTRANIIIYMLRPCRAKHSMVW